MNHLTASEEDLAREYLRSGNSPRSVGPVDITSGVLGPCPAAENRKFGYGGSCTHSGVISFFGGKYVCSLNRISAGIY
jgi:hypothetical protein